MDDAPRSPVFSFIVPATMVDATSCNDGTTSSFPAEPWKSTDDDKGDDDDSNDAPDDGSGRVWDWEEDWDCDWGGTGGVPKARPSPFVGAAKFAYFSKRTRCWVSSAVAPHRTVCVSCSTAAGRRDAKHSPSKHTRIHTILPGSNPWCHKNKICWTFFLSSSLDSWLTVDYLSLKFLHTKYLHQFFTENKTHVWTRLIFTLIAVMTPCRCIEFIVNTMSLFLEQIYIRWVVPFHNFYK